MKLPRILIAAGASGSGKTLITCGILRALMRRGLMPAAFKCGPDYIDPMFHTEVVGVRSRNLDTFLADREIMAGVLERNSRDADLAVIEGVMGYYDGLGGTSTEASTYDVARAIKAPVILLVASRGMSLSLAAYINGFKSFRQDSNIKGVILNRISPMIYRRLKPEIERECRLKVIGYVPELPECRLESRHLGLIMPGEIGRINEKLDRLADVLNQSLDLDLMIQIAGDVLKTERGDAPKTTFHEKDPPFRLTEPVSVAVARDEAFCFLYEDNLELLREMGADIIEFSPLRDHSVPGKASGLILPGGYPELFAPELAGNRSMKASILKLCDGGMPLLAECGGFMYLHDTFESDQSEAFEGVGLIRGRSYRTPRLNRFGYVTLSRNAADTERIDSGSERSGFFRHLNSDPGAFAAHEFHYFDSTSCGEDFTAVKPSGTAAWRCIHETDTMLAGFPHFYYRGNSAIAEAFLRNCQEYAQVRGLTDFSSCI